MSRLLLIALVVFGLLFSACQHKHRGVFMQSSSVQLSKPLIRVDSVFFYESAEIYIAEPPAKSQVYCVEDSREENEEASLAGKKMTITESGQFRFNSRSNDFIASEEIELELFKVTSQNLTIEKASEAKEPYNQASPDILFDHHKAGKNFRKGDWLGYQEEVITFELALSSGPVSGLALSFLEDQHSWIFGPASMEANFYDDAGKLIVEAQANYMAEKEQKGSALRFLKINMAEIVATRIKVTIRNLASIPDWHPSKGHSPWLFLDEIVIL